MEQEEQKLNSLPDNAYRELKPGEVYKPIMPANSKPREVTTYSVVFGIIMAIVFSAAAAYLGLKVGQVFEAAIPIAIIAVGCGNLMKKNNMLGQNVIIQSIGASSGVIVAGAIFTLPALYILGLDAKFYQIFLSSLLGGLLGILMLIPFRKYFVKDMHGKYPFPEATATTASPMRMRPPSGRIARRTTRSYSMRSQARNSSIHALWSRGRMRSVSSGSVRLTSPTRGTSAWTILSISEGSISKWMIRALGPKAAGSPVTRSSKRIPTATSRSHSLFLMLGP